MKAKVLVPLFALLLGGAGCGDSPTGGGSAIASDPVTPANALPTPEGASWTYALEGKVLREDLNWDNVYENIEDVPPALTLDEVIALAAEQAHGTTQPLSKDRGTLDWALTFAFQTGDTLRCQFNREEAWESGKSLGSAGRGWQPSLALDSRAHYGYFGPGAPQLWLGPESLGYPANDFSAGIPLLEGQLQPGDEFSRELFADTYLHCRVLGKQAVSTPAGVFADALACFYYVEYPALGVISGGGPEQYDGYVRALDYETIYWVAGVGPVKATLRGLITVGGTVDEGSQGISVSLTSASVMD